MLPPRPAPLELLCDVGDDPTAVGPDGLPRVPSQPGEHVWKYVSGSPLK